MPTDIESIIREYYDKNFSKLRCLRFLKTLINKIDNRRYFKNHNSLVSIKKKKLEFRIENHLTMKIPDLDGCISGLNLMLKLVIIHN